MQHSTVPPLLQNTPGVPVGIDEGLGDQSSLRRSFVNIVPLRAYISRRSCAVYQKARNIVLVWASLIPL